MPFRVERSLAPVWFPWQAPFGLAAINNRAGARIRALRSEGKWRFILLESKGKPAQPLLAPTGSSWGPAFSKIFTVQNSSLRCLGFFFLFSHFKNVMYLYIKYIYNIYNSVKCIYNKNCNMYIAYWSCFSGKPWLIHLEILSYFYIN